MNNRTTWRPLGLALLALLALAATAALGPGAAAQSEPRFSRLNIAIWPEFDLPQALVIIRGELAPDTTLPARVSLHIPAAAGAPNAVASGSDPTAGLVIRPYETTTEGDSLLVTLETPDPIVQVEFYVPLSRDGIDREFTYVWPGDLAADEVTLRAQMPTGAEDFQAEPQLGPEEVGQHGLLYREATLGGLEAGETQSFRIQYSKEDTGLSADTLPTAGPAGDGDGFPLGWPALTAMAAAALVGVAALVWFRFSKRGPAAAHPPRGPSPGGREAASTAYCTQCGQPLSPEDRFCSRCGSRTRRQ